MIFILFLLPLQPKLNYYILSVIRHMVKINKRPSFKKPTMRILLFSFIWSFAKSIIITLTIIKYISLFHVTFFMPRIRLLLVCKLLLLLQFKLLPHTYTKTNIKELQSASPRYTKATWMVDLFDGCI